jgi:hypothetical protein
MPQKSLLLTEQVVISSWWWIGGSCNRKIERVIFCRGRGCLSKKGRCFVEERHVLAIALHSVFSFLPPPLVLYSIMGFFDAVLKGSSGGGGGDLPDRATCVKYAALFSGAMMNPFLRARLAVPLGLMPTFVGQLFSFRGLEDVSTPLQWLYRTKTLCFLMWLECNHRLNIADAGGAEAVEAKPELMFQDLLPHLKHLADLEKKQKRVANGLDGDVSHHHVYCMLLTSAPSTDPPSPLLPSLLPFPPGRGR